MCHPLSLLTNTTIPHLQIKYCITKTEQDTQKEKTFLSSQKQSLRKLKENERPTMSEVKDPTIKLFGKTILVIPEEEDEVVPVMINPSTMVSVHHHLNLSSSTTSTSPDSKNPVQNNWKPSGGESNGREVIDLNINDDPRTPYVDDETAAEELVCPATSSGISEDPKPPTVNKEDPSDAGDSDEKTLKRPVKLLPCPRCNSMDTKFCYFNNYNVNQPRYFCRKCQRFWTAGGTMRNVPIGSGRRKNKSYHASHHHHIRVSKVLQAARADAAVVGIHHQNLTFGSNSQTFVRNGLQCQEQRIQVSYGDDRSSGCSSTISNPNDKGSSGGPESVYKGVQASPTNVTCFPMPAWPNPAWNSTQWRSPMPQPSFVPPGFSMPFYQAPPCWGCTAPNPWSMPWPGQPSMQLAYPTGSAVNSSPNSQTLGKHSRDGDMTRPSKQDQKQDLEECVLVPKILRINDPNEAAKSSIWSTLGIKNDTTDSVNAASLHKAFQSKSMEKNRVHDVSLVLQANPAALSRSLNFHEVG